MPSISYTLTRPSEAFGENDYQLTVYYEVAAHYPGNSWGLPEDCEPPSGGEIEELMVEHDGKPFALTDDEQTKLEAHIYETHDYSDDSYDEGDYD